MVRYLEWEGAFFIPIRWMDERSLHMHFRVQDGFERFFKYEVIHDSNATWACVCLTLLLFDEVQSKYATC